METVYGYYLLLRRVLSRGYELDLQDKIMLRKVCPHPERYNRSRGPAWHICSLCSLAMPRDNVLTDLMDRITKDNKKRGE